MISAIICIWIRLAGEFIARGWSVKAMQRLIVTSATYRQAGAPNPKAMTLDASNRLLWRFPPRRLEAEPLRDTILAVSGQLDLRMGGPGFDLFEPNTNYVKVYATKTKFAPDDFRRMVYQNKPRVELDTLFGAFDCPDAGQIQPKRNVSTTALQALNLLNSEFMVEQSRLLDLGPCPITTGVVHEHNLVGERLAFERLADFLSQGQDVILFFKHRNDNGQLCSR